MAATSAVLVPLEEYLHTTYRPDRDWIDGEAKERNMGEGPHAMVQGFFIARPAYPLPLFDQVKRDARGRPRFGTPVSMSVPPPTRNSLRVKR